MMKIGAMLGDVTRSLFKKPVTELYPFERKPAPEHLRGKLIWNPEKCTGCQLCVKDCPSNAIELFTIDKAAKRFVMRYHTDRCTFCAQCVQNCRFNCLELSSEQWELASATKEVFDIHYGADEEIWVAMLRWNLMRGRSAGDPLPRGAVMGVGSDLRGDDAAGVSVVRRLMQETLPDRVMLIDAGSAPENFTAPLRRFAPDWVLWVDAAQMGDAPGEIRWLEISQTVGLSASTHTLPPHVLGVFLTADLNCQMAVIGIQPVQNNFDAPLSAPVAAAVDEVARVLTEELKKVVLDE
ncbi:MAG: hydrogenase maturation protease [Anaerolineaceae bacterium]